MVRSAGCAWALAMMLAMVSAGCTAASVVRPVPTARPLEPASIPRPISLPSDEGAHANNLEWWYYNGHLLTDSGVEYGFHFVIFQSFLGDEAGYAAHFGITDVEGGAHRHDYRLDSSSGPTLGRAVELSVSGWRLGIEEGVHLFSVTGDGASLRLSLEPSTPPMLHDETGWLNGPFGWTYYYSWPRMDAVGVLELDGEEFRVTGEAWFDHQWGDFFVMGYPAGWQWMAIQLDDGSSLMLNESRGLDGEVLETIGSFMDSSGQVTALRSGRDGVSIEALDTWTSPDTGGVYPSRWRVGVDSLDLRMEVLPLVSDQEIDEGVPEPSIYWEGKSVVRGAVGGKAVAGRAYVELTGYAHPRPIEWR